MTSSELRDQLEQLHAAAFGWALACCKGDRAEAEDVLHDAYLAVLNGAAHFDGRSSFRTWLFGVIRLTAVSQRRRSWLRTLLLMRGNGSAPAGHAAPADVEAELRSRNERVRSALDTLAERQREVLHLVFYQDMTVEEAAISMGVSVGSARTHYARGKERIARLLKYGGEL